VRRALTWGIWLVPALAFVHGLSYAWRRTGELTVDWGRELEVARELAAGQTLYRDCQYWYGPVAPHLNALLFRLFGVHAEVLMTAGFASAAVMAALLGLLARRFAGALAGATVATLFVYTCAFGHYLVNDVFNWATPYAYAATYGMVTATASLVCLVRYVDTDRYAWLVASLALLDATVLTKLEPAFAAGLAHGAFVAVALARGTAGRRVLAAYGGAALVLAVLIGWVSVASGGASYDANVLSQLSARNLGPILVYMGLADWQNALGDVAISAARLALAFAPAVAAGFLLSEEGLRIAAPVAAVIAFATVATANPLKVLRAVPIVVLVGLAGAAWRVARERTALAELLVWTFAAGALARIPLSAGAHHYGFYLLPVSLAALVPWVMQELPRRRPDSATLASAAAVGLAAGLCWGHGSVAQSMWAAHQTPIATARGTFFIRTSVGNIPVGDYYSSALARLREYPPATTVMVAPDGIALAFFAGLPSWGRRYTYYPPEVGGDEGDLRLRAELAADPPDLVVLMNILNLDAYGVRGFGIDYARASVDWMRSRYGVDRIFGPQAVAIVRRHELPAP
jgi:hypothetical protein